MYTIEYSKDADKTLRKWKKSNPNLIGGNDITYSRHITAHDRIIYDIFDSRVSVLIVQAEEHYTDK